MRRPSLPSKGLRPVRLAVVLGALVVAVLLVLWRVDVHHVQRAFEFVEWKWIALAVVVNFLSIVVRSVAWKIVVDQAVPPPPPRHRSVFAAFSIGLLGNAALPGRVGEIARVIVLNRRMRRRPGNWATLLGTVFAHRLFDVVVAACLVIFVVYTARIPDWARPALSIALGIGLGLLAAALLVSRRRTRSSFEGLSPVRRALSMGRQGLTVLKRPGPAIGALMFQIVAWMAQLLAVWIVFRAFDIHAPIEAAALVLVIMNLVSVFPLWPGNVGLLQAAVALSLLSYGVGYARGFAYGIGLQAVEAGVGIALGLIFLAREGVSFATLRRMPDVGDVELESPVKRVA
jgi:uncharacterized protein (TIRG00374 family)